ncbi:MAG: very short patch repair endonuclease [Aliidongia sp.]
MVDILSLKARSALMSAVRSSGTRPEMRVRRLAHALGLRYSVAPRKVSGRPDLCFPGARIAIFVHGCFWHRHVGCRKASTPASNVEFWASKFEDNLKRDERVMRELLDAGWKTIVIWECETKDPELILRQLQLVQAHYQNRRSALGGRLSPSGSIVGEGTG